MENLKEKFKNLKIQTQPKECITMQTIQEVKQSRIVYLLNKSDFDNPIKKSWWIYLNLYIAIYEYVEKNTLHKYIQDWYLKNDESNLLFFEINSTLSFELIQFIRLFIKKPLIERKEMDFNTLL